MPRNLDLTALRSFLTVAESGGVTRAAGLLNLTQSAVSMQIRRLEEGLGLDLLDRSGRGVALTPAGEQLLAYARRLIALNDEALARLTARGQEGEIVLGVPCDIVFPAIPAVLRRFARDFPRIKVNLVSSFTRMLKDGFERGAIDVILTTEDHVPPGAETLAVLPLVWVGARGGRAWRERPLRLAFSTQCIFRQPVQRCLDRAGIPWEMAVETASDGSVQATVSADLAVQTLLDGTFAARDDSLFEVIDHGGALPELWSVHINLYARSPAVLPAQADLLELIRQEYGAAGSGGGRLVAA
ncbi:transcriptional regulator, LysR family [Rubellimicrobium thermophilum DSM 16684]|uniref:Transcriptional regulator, LysR family n=1 Tax=Rubellimicrobium thermophilum DSM 16684 TaxID=1123069 RepID=S9QSY7_9RHOB|nr:LysR family transcriptional regulator [Rubellimicrobium thermophilum]EPX82773.1 transcriptional regulator, LysR family [Rubellimicrobium thermophilum DSM 16684]